jgi:hypothetical protein
MQMNQVIQNVHPVISDERLQAQSSGDGSADSGEQLIKREEGQMAVDDNLVSMDMEHGKQSGPSR